MAIAEIKDQDLEFFRTEFQKVHKEISKVIVGYDDVIDDILMTLLARGHALLEGVPGLGKTKLVANPQRCASPEVCPHPVHTRPHACRYRGHQRGA
jgi:MoxR-like ATPase